MAISKFIGARRKLSSFTHPPPPLSLSLSYVSVSVFFFASYSFLSLSQFLSLIPFTVSISLLSSPYLPLYLSISLPSLPLPILSFYLSLSFTSLSHLSLSSLSLCLPLAIVCLYFCDDCSAVISYTKQSPAFDSGPAKSILYYSFNEINKSPESSCCWIKCQSILPLTFMFSFSLPCSAMTWTRHHVEVAETCDHNHPHTSHLTECIRVFIKDSYTSTFQTGSNNQMYGCMVSWGLGCIVFPLCLGVFQVRIEKT